MQVSAAWSEQGTGEEQVQGMMAQACDMVFSTVHHICTGSIVTRLHSGQFGVQFPAEARDFSLLRMSS